MAAGALAVENAASLIGETVRIVEAYGLEARRGVVSGRRLWGSPRTIDVIIWGQGLPASGVGLDCVYQGTRGSAELKVFAKLADMAAWPMPSLLVYDGEGFSPGVVGYLESTGRAVSLERLAKRLEAFTTKQLVRGRR